MKTCTWCENKATKQTEKGKYQEKIGGLPQNHGWFCDDCWKKGTDAEKEAMYS